MASSVRDILLTEFSRRGFSPDEAQTSALLVYLSLLDKWNKRVRLTGTRDPRKIAGALVPEALDFLLLWTPRPGERVLDVGAGGGISGLPLGILFPDLDVVMVESSGRKAAFLAEAVRAVGVGRLRVIHDRVENLAGASDQKGTGHAGRYHAILCRAVSAAPDILPRVWPLLAPEGRVLIRQGRRAEEETEAALPVLKSLGAVLAGEHALMNGRMIAVARNR